MEACRKERGLVATGVRQRDRKHWITPGDARTSANPTRGASARLVNLYSNCVCEVFSLCLFAVVFICYFLAM